MPTGKVGVEVENCETSMLVMPSSLGLELCSVRVSRDNGIEKVKRVRSDGHTELGTSSLT